jgi:hypothetical protein
MFTIKFEKGVDKMELMWYNVSTIKIKKGLDLNVGLLLQTQGYLF